MHNEQLSKISNLFQTDTIDRERDVTKPNWKTFGFSDCE